LPWNEEGIQTTIPFLGPGAWLWEEGCGHPRQQNEYLKRKMRSTIVKILGKIRAYSINVIYYVRSFHWGSHQTS
jgi:hypothetical protein